MKPLCRCFRLQAHGAPLVPVETELPEPQGSEAVVRVLAAGVCHSDLFLQDGFIDTGTGRRLDMSRSVAVPRVLGHEIAGVVHAVGPDAKTARAGDRVVAFPWIGCGSCSLCAAGQEHLCSNARNLGVGADGGFAQFVRVPHERYLVPMGSLAPEQAATYACSGLTAYSALRKLAPFPADGRLLVIGAGGVGLSGVRLARRLLGAAPIVAEIDRSKWALALDAGAADAIDPSDPEAGRALMKATGGGVAGVVDFVGTGESFAFGFGALRKGGRMVSVGMIGGSTPFVPALMPFKAATLIGSYVGSCDELRELLALAQDGTLPPLPVQTMPLEAVNEALDRLRGGRVAGRAVLTP